MGKRAPAESRPGHADQTQQSAERNQTRNSRRRLKTNPRSGKIKVSKVGRFDLRDRSLSYHQIDRDWYLFSTSDSRPCPKRKALILLETFCEVWVISR
jgi:hypothetical protein